MPDFSQLLADPQWQGLQDWQVPDPNTEPPPLEVDPEFQRIMAMQRANPAYVPNPADRRALAAYNFQLPNVRVNYRTLGTGGRVGIGLLAALQGLANAYGASKMPEITARQQAAEDAAKRSDQVRAMLTQDLLEKRRAARQNAGKVRYRLPQSGQTVYISPDRAATVEQDRRLMPFTYPDGTTAMLTPSEYNAAVQVSKPKQATPGTGPDAVAARKQASTISSYNARLRAIENRMERWKSVLNNPNSDQSQLPRAQAEYDRLSGEYDRLSQEMSDKLEGKTPALAPAGKVPTGKMTADLNGRATYIVEQARRADLLRDPQQRAQAQQMVKTTLARWEQETPGVAARVKELSAGGR